MTGIRERLTDAMSAAAGIVREQEVRPLVMPKRRWRQPPWAAPAAAAVAVVLVIGLVVSASNGLFGTHRAGGLVHLPAAPHRFYLATDLGSWKTVVRSTATGKVVAVVPVPSLEAGGLPVSPALAAAGNGMFYLAAFAHGIPGEQIYRFRLTAAGHVTEFAPVPGGSLSPGWAADALAASPDGSLVAVGAYYYRDHRHHGQTYGPERSDQLVVVHTVTGARSTWRGGSLARGYTYFRVASLSWTGDGRELAVLGQWCRVASDPGGETCPRWERQAQVRGIDPTGRSGGSVLGGRLLLRQSPRVPFLAQALISPDGSVLTAVVLRGRVVGSSQISGFFPQNLSVERISVATGFQFSVLYQQHLGNTSEVSGAMADPLALSADTTGRNLILNAGICNPGCTNEVNGWLHAGRLVPLPPGGFNHREAAEAW
jgi:hypothetical protein